MKTRRDRFRKVAESRVQDIMKKMSLLGNCSNRNNYEYDEKDVKKMFNAIKEQLKQTERQFQDNLNKMDKSKFKF